MGWSRKWFDYRHMTLLQATHKYMEVYGDIYRRIFAREFDRERAEHIRPLNFDTILGALRPDGQVDTKKVTKAKKQLVGCWRGRQVADMLGCPYEVYIDLAFTYRMRRWKQNNMPQPLHLYHEYDVEKIADRWEEAAGKPALSGRTLRLPGSKLPRSAAAERLPRVALQAGQAPLKPRRVRRSVHR
ncbi:hypothetical protein U8P73_36690 (plasmid) [Rhizobium beringeri]|uniref:hypothetical protein n=1 Tax=Rhizobium beringeri TaxID=3019934 RepID=UPI002DDDA81D|nr:hypothetical protein [Rhizobium beringeri]WSG93511.1 hypothetical protein U8P73_36690 [Rhizobium beringeri]